MDACRNGLDLQKALKETCSASDAALDHKLAELNSRPRVTNPNAEGISQLAQMTLKNDADTAAVNQVSADWTKKIQAQNGAMVLMLLALAVEKQTGKMFYNYDIDCQRHENPVMTNWLSKVCPIKAYQLMDVAQELSEGSKTIEEVHAFAVLSLAQLPGTTLAEIKETAKSFKVIPTWFTLDQLLGDVDLLRLISHSTTPEGMKNLYMDAKDKERLASLAMQRTDHDHRMLNVVKDWISLFVSQDVALSQQFVEDMKRRVGLSTTQYNYVVHTHLQPASVK